MIPIMIVIKRIYEPQDPKDGFRVLVDRLWPRGISKEKAALGIWLKDIGPSNELRTWFNHEPAKWPQFRQKYRQELRQNSELATLRELVKKHPKITLLYSARDEQRNQAVVIA